MLRNLNKSSAGRRILGTWNVGIDAATIAAETATGDSGPGLLYDESIDPANAGKQLRCRVTGYTGTSSALFVWENGAVQVIGESPGSYIISYAVDADNVQIKTDTATVSVGVVNAGAEGGTGTVTITGSGGEAIGQVNASSEGGTGTIAITGTGGEASGQANASAEGGTGTVTITGTGGEATGSSSGTDANAEGGTGTVNITGSGGEATGQANASAEGGTGTVTVTGTGGEAAGGGTFSGSLSDADIARIAAAVLALLQANPLPVNAVQMNSSPIIGDGSEADMWRGEGVSP